MTITVLVAQKKKKSESVCCKVTDMVLCTPSVFTREAIRTNYVIAVSLKSNTINKALIFPLMLLI